MDPFEFFYQPRGNSEPRTSHGQTGRFRGHRLDGGAIITNNHAVDQVDEIEVQMSDGRTKAWVVSGCDGQTGGLKVR